MNKKHGFSLIELLSAIAIVSILTAVALPKYQAYIVRSQIIEGLQRLSVMGVVMSQYLQDTGRYNAADNSVECGKPVPEETKNFTFSCIASNDAFTVKMAGKGMYDGVYEYALNNNGNRITLKSKNGVNDKCWVIDQDCQ